MRFGRGLQAEFESVNILRKNPRSGDVDTIATGVRIVILPIPSSPNDIGDDLRRPYRERYGAILETPRDDFRERNDIVERADNSQLIIRRVLSVSGYQELELESVGSI